MPDLKELKNDTEVRLLQLVQEMRKEIPELLLKDHLILQDHLPM